MAIRLPIDWDGVIPDENVPFSEWLVTGTILAEKPVAFDPLVESEVFTLVIDKMVDVASGLNLEANTVTLKATGNGVFVLSNLVRDGGAYFSVYPSTRPLEVVEGMLTSAKAQSAQDIRDALGLTTANLTTSLASILSAAQSGYVSASSVRTALGLVTNNLDSQLASILSAASAALDATAMRVALGLSSADLDAQLAAILEAVGGQIPGDILFTWTEYQTGHNGDPNYVVPDVTVLVYANANATGFPITSGVTDELGQVKFYLDEGTYYIFRRKAGRTFSNPVTIEVS